VNAVWARLRSELRSRVAALIGLGLLIGITGGVVMTAAEGARRTESAYPRFVEAQRAMDFFVTAESVASRSVLDRIPSLPGVEAATRVFLIPGGVRTSDGRKVDYPNLFPLADPTGRFGTTINRFKILQGRAPDPSRADEAMLAKPVADQLRVRPGDRLQFSVLEELLSGELTDRVVATLSLTVAGIELSPGELESVAGTSLPALHLTPAFFRAHRALAPPGEEVIAVKLAPGVSQDAFQRTLQTRARGTTVSLPQREKTAIQQRSNGFQAVALWLIAAMVALAGLGVWGQTLARQTYLESSDYPILRSFGMTTGQLVATSALRAAVAGVVASVVAFAVAVVLSPLTPIGPARLVEPNPGIVLDWPVLAIGVCAILLVSVLLALPAAWRAAHLRAGIGGLAEPPSVGFSRLGNRLAARGFPPTMVAGVRMALEPGRGRSSVPVRSAFVGTTFGIAALMAALGFGRSLDHLVQTPALQGWNWTMILVENQEFPSPAVMHLLDQTVRGHPEVVATTAGAFNEIRVDGSAEFTIALAPGPVGPSVIEGRAPSAPEEIALGTDTMRALGLRIGDTVQLTVPGNRADRRAKVVGRVVLPVLIFSSGRPDRGAVMSLKGIARVLPGTIVNSLFVRLKPGSDVDVAVRDFRSAGLFVLTPLQSEESATLGRLSRMPLLLAALLALLSLGTLVHALVTTIRRRRHDLAILKTVGFVRRQVWSTVAWQATTLAFVSAAAGVPLGIAAGRWGWHLFTDRLGMVPVTRVPWLAVVVVLPAVLLLANAVAYVPGRLAGRLRPATVLRSE
jgi:ABC-type lipoprotein release transport system permease subunit